MTKLCECGCGKPAPIAKLTNQKYGWIAGQPCRFLPGHGTRVQKRANSYRHGMSKKPEYNAYYGAKQRCSAKPGMKNWKDYGGKGIKFLFTSFEQFFAELGSKPSPKHSLDRFPNNDGHYEPGNVRWATPKEQANNRPQYKRMWIQGKLQKLSSETTQQEATL